MKIQNDFIKLGKCFDSKKLKANEGKDVVHIKWGITGLDDSITENSLGIIVDNKLNQSAILWSLQKGKYHLWMLFYRSIVTQVK